MSSSLIPVPIVDSTGPLVRASLVEVLAQVTDPRKARGKRHGLAGVLAAGVGAVLAGACSLTAIGEWVREAGDQVLTELGIAAGRRPSSATIRRVFISVDADLLDRLIGTWLWTRTATIEGRRVIAIDGKTVRGARTTTKSAANSATTDVAAPHLVSALDHTAGVVLGQVQVAVKSNEIPALRDLLAGFADLADVVVTADALHTQRDTATYIVNRGGHYVFTVKKNQPSLYQACKKLPWRDVPSHTSVDETHGRRVRRSIKAVQAPAWLDFPHAAQIAQVRRTRTRTRKGRKTVEIVYIISSLDTITAPPATIASWIQGHWGIENRLHWVRDVTYDEDRSQIRTGNAPRVMATLRSTAISLLRLTGHTNIAAALRHHARDPHRPLQLILNR